MVRGITDTVRLMAVFLVVLSAAAGGHDASPLAYDHHVHMLSPTLIGHWKSLGMRFSRADAAYTDPRRVLKDEGVAGAFLVSMAHLYSTEGFRRVEEIRSREQELVRAENDFIAKCVVTDPRRLVGFFSVNPLAEYAFDELDRCKQKPSLTGLKLHLPACGLDLLNRQHLARLDAVFDWAEREHVPVLLHLFSGGTVDPVQVSRFWRLVESHADISLQLAHLGAAGGYNDSSKAILDQYERLRALDESFKRAQVWFDLSGAIIVNQVDGVGPTSEADCAALSRAIRRIGVDRFLFASDYPVFSADQTVKALREKLELTDDELTLLLQNRSAYFQTLDQMDPAKHLSTCTGFSLPETVIHDVKRDRYLVSCMVGNPTAQDNNGEVRAIDPAKPDQSYAFIRGGAGGVTLNGPKGMALHQDTLWIADIETLRGFDATTGRPTKTIGLQPHGAVAINDLAVGGDGTIYVSDPRLLFDDDGNASHIGIDRIFAIAANETVRTLMESAELSQPNGLAWDAKANRLLVAPLDSRDVLSLDPRGPRIAKVARGAGRFDGIEVLPDGAIFVSCLREGTILDVLRPDAAPIVSGRKLPGNFGVDRRRSRLLIPLIGEGTVEVWKF